MSDKPLRAPEYKSGDANLMDRMMKRTIRHEGGFTTDHAGPTNIGITQGTYKAWRANKGLSDQPVSKITLAEVKDIYDNEYYKKPGINKLPERLSEVVFDYGINAGPIKAIKTLQKVVGVSQDGKIGKDTLAAVNKISEEKVIEGLLTERQKHYNSLVQSNEKKYGKFKSGWENRVASLRKEFLKNN